jgi:hypothetical protein
VQDLGMIEGKLRLDLPAIDREPSGVCRQHGAGRVLRQQREGRLVV